LGTSNNNNSNSSGFGLIRGHCYSILQVCASGQVLDSSVLPPAIFSYSNSNKTS
jgi:hypothetical protein